MECCDERLLSVDETCERLGGISTGTLWKLCRDGRLTAIRIGTRKFFEPSEITRFVVASRVSTVAKEQNPPNGEST